jgi:hypothetical protein
VKKMMMEEVDSVDLVPMVCFCWMEEDLDFVIVADIVDEMKILCFLVVVVLRPEVLLRELGRGQVVFLNVYCLLIVLL